MPNANNQNDAERENYTRKCLRLSCYDYSQSGFYFITICTQNRHYLFGNINDGIMQLNDCGNIANNYLIKLPEKYPQTKLPEYIIMPNHLHFIVEIIGNKLNPAVTRIAKCQTPNEFTAQRRKMLLAKIIGWYKMNVAKQINFRCENTDQSIWQRNYYEHIIRDDDGYNKISEYVKNNPALWESDRFCRKIGAMIFAIIKMRKTLIFVE